ncbi:MAG TPA: hypothetical protein PKJ29_10750 [Giesbergeria sp.]|nr:hypothetical protein [Giesbergeria sp.]
MAAPWWPVEATICVGKNGIQLSKALWPCGLPSGGEAFAALQATVGVQYMGIQALAQSSANSTTGAGASEHADERGSHQSQPTHPKVGQARKMLPQALKRLEATADPASHSAQQCSRFMTPVALRHPH